LTVRLISLTVNPEPVEGVDLRLKKKEIRFSG